MTFLRLAALLAATSLLRAEEPPPGNSASPSPEPVGTPKWDVSIPDQVADDTAVETAGNPEPAPATIISSNTIQKQVTEPAPISGVPPVAGTINITIEVAEEVDLPNPQPLPPSAPTDPAIQTGFHGPFPTYQQTRLVFVSASVYNNHRTLLRISPNGAAADDHQLQRRTQDRRRTQTKRRKRFRFKKPGNN